MHGFLNASNISLIRALNFAAVDEPLQHPIGSGAAGPAKLWNVKNVFEAGRSHQRKSEEDFPSAAQTLVARRDIRPVER